MPITREQPAEVFKTSDGRLFDNAEEAHCHERDVRLRGLVNAWFKTNKPTGPGTVGFTMHADAMVADIANHIACVVRDTPLANA